MSETSEDNLSLIIYEHPISELVRFCLRFEFLYEQLTYNCKNTHVGHHREALQNIVQLQPLLERADFKSKLNKELQRQMEMLQRLRHHQDIDTERLQDTIKNLDHALSTLHSTDTRTIQTLRNHELIVALRQQHASPNTASDHELPLLTYWLNQHPEHHQVYFQNWLVALSDLQPAIYLVLQLLRQSIAPQQQTAFGGFYQSPLNPQTTYALLRIGVPQTTAAYPEFNISRHRFCIRFYYPDNKEKTATAVGNVDFLLMCCAL